MKKIIVLLLTSVLIISCNKDDINEITEPICTEFSNGINLDLSNPLNEDAIAPEAIVIDDGVIISDINVRIETKCPDDVWNCGVSFREMYLYFRDEFGDEIIIRLVDRFDRGGEVFTETTFDNESKHLLNYDNYHCAGPFKPIEDLSKLYGVNSKGTWYLVFQQPNRYTAYGETYLDKWTIEICSN